MRRIYAVVLSILILVTASFWTLYKYNVLEFEELWLNLFSEMLGTIFAVVTIDVLIRWHHERDRRNREMRALQQLHRPIMHLLGTCFDMYKAAVANTPATTTTEFRDFFSSDYFDEVSNLDLAANSGVSERGVTPWSWMERLSNDIRGARDEMERVGSHYEAYLTPRLSTVMAEAHTASFVYFALSLRDSWIADRSSGIVRNYDYFGNPGIRKIFQEYVSILVKIVEYLNMELSNQRRLDVSAFTWRNDIAPGVGSGRIKKKLENVPGFYVVDSVERLPSASKENLTDNGD